MSNPFYLLCGFFWLKVDFFAFGKNTRTFILELFFICLTLFKTLYTQAILCKYKVSKELRIVVIFKIYGIRTWKRRQNAPCSKNIYTRYSKKYHCQWIFQLMPCTHHSIHGNHSFSVLYLNLCSIQFFLSTANILNTTSEQDNTILPAMYFSVYFFVIFLRHERGCLLFSVFWTSLHIKISRKTVTCAVIFFIWCIVRNLLPIKN